MSTYNFFKFPAGEVHCKLENYGEYLYKPLEDGENLSDHILSLIMALSVPGAPKKLILPYLPFSRQDRPTSGKEPFSLKVFGNLLNTLKLERVVTLDTHSDVAFACIDNLRNVEIVDILGKLGDTFKERHQNSTLVIPDQGAYKKLKSANFKKKVTAIKERDVSTGFVELKGFFGNVEGEDCLIVDDICEGGRTFTELSTALYKAGASTVELFVTHGSFTKGLKPLFDSGIRQVYTTNSFFQKEEGHKTVFDVKRFLG